MSNGKIGRVKHPVTREYYAVELDFGARRILRVSEPRPDSEPDTVTNIRYALEFEEEELESLDFTFEEVVATFSPPSVRQPLTEKNISDRTVTSVEILADETKVTELSQMLGSVTVQSGLNPR